jgi:uncharacterized SAM-binding protein YcdF (DUF218 family)
MVVATSNPGRLLRLSSARADRGTYTSDVRDAQTEALPLVGGGEHDWAFLLDHWGVLERDQAIGRTVYLAGMVCYLAAVVGGWLALRAQEPMMTSSAKETS